EAVGPFRVRRDVFPPEPRLAGQPRVRQRHPPDAEEALPVDRLLHRLRQDQLARRSPDGPRLRRPENRSRQPGIRSDRLVSARRPRRAVQKLVGKGRKLVRRGVATARLLSPAKLYQAREHARSRRQGEVVLADFMASAEARFTGPVLVDAMWDNPNYWIRYALFRAAVGSAGGREVGVVGTHRAAEGRRTLARFGISRAGQGLGLRGGPAADRRAAQRLLRHTSTPGDVLSWDLPHGVPADFVYDGVLKRQRSAIVDLRDRRLLGYVTEALASISAAEALLDSERFELVLLSHA